METSSDALDSSVISICFLLFFTRTLHRGLLEEYMCVRVRVHKVADPY